MNELKVNYECIIDKLQMSYEIITNRMFLREEHDWISGSLKFH
jgi:hypothetical protein